MIQVGVPQGSVLDPHLYSIFTADFSKNPGWHTRPFLLADDTAILCRSIGAKGVTTRLNAAAASAWCRWWRIQLNPAKTKVIMFRRIKRAASAPAAKLNSNFFP
jgi:hypothetical protein